MNDEDLTAEERELLERRAHRLKAPLEHEGEQASEWVAVFSLGETRYGILLERLRAAVPLRLVTPVPLAPPDVIGVLRFRGDVLCALSLSALIGSRGWQTDPSLLLIVETSDGRRVALDSSEVPTAIQIPAAAIGRAQAIGRGLAAEVMLGGSETLKLIDVDRLLDVRLERGARGD